MKKSGITLLLTLVVFLNFGFVFADNDKKNASNESVKVLITGFAPFGGEKINPSFEAVKMLPDKIQNAEVIKKELPVTFTGSVTGIQKFIKELNPDIIICVGQAGGRFDISVERVAINIDDARIPDNENKQPIDEKIFDDGENAYFSTLPIKAIVENIKKNGIPASISNTAGTYVCNHIMYALLYILHKKYHGKIGGFIHVPYIPSQAVGKKNAPNLSLQDISKALGIAIETSIKYESDIKVTGGKEN